MIRLFTHLGLTLFRDIRGCTPYFVNFRQFARKGSPEQFTAFIRSETVKWGAAVKRAGITPE